MLYELWRQTVDREGGRRAVLDLAVNRSWSFRELDAAAVREEASGAGCAFPQGSTVEFLLEVIRGWRTGQVICPLDLGQRVPGLKGAPAGCVHLKATSATTGRARYVGFTGPQLAADLDNIVSTMGLRAEWPNLGVISLAHSYGFSNLVLPLLLRGIPLILGCSALPEAVRKATENLGPLTVPAVPALWRAWHEAGAIIPGLRLAISAGAPLSLALETRVFDVVGVKIHNFYGASECGGIAYDSSELPRTEETFVGRPMRNVEVSIEDDGCLSVRSQAVGQTYWPRPSVRLGNGRYLTRDLGRLRGDAVHLVGRATDVINVAGRKVVPETVEQALLEHPEVAACLVFGVPEGGVGQGEIVLALLVVRRPLPASELRRFLADRLSPWQIPRVWKVVENLAVNQRGKISRADWRRRYLAGDAGIGSLA